MGQSPWKDASTSALSDVKSECPTYGNFTLVILADIQKFAQKQVLTKFFRFGWREMKMADVEDSYVRYFGWCDFKSFGGRLYGYFWEFIIGPMFYLCQCWTTGIIMLHFNVIERLYCTSDTIKIINIFKCIFLKGNISTLIQISMVP